MADSLSPKSPTLQATIFVTISSFVAILLLSVFMKIEVVAQGKGKFIPKARTQIIQSEFGGRIEAIHITDGNIVQKGDILIELNNTAPKAELDNINFEMLNLELVHDRINQSLILLSAGSIDEGHIVRALQAFESAYATQPSSPVFLSQKGLLEAEANFIVSNLGRMDAELTAVDQSSQMIQISMDQAASTETVQQKRFETIKTLRENGTATQLQFDEASENLGRSVSETKLREAEFEQNQSRRAILEQRKDSFIKEKINALSQQKNEVLSELSQLRQRQTTIRRELTASQIRSPIDGTVDQLAVHTIGGVTEAGEELLRLVPNTNDLIFEAVVSNQNVAFLEIGLPAKLSIDAYPSGRFGFLNGLVSHISADSIEIDEQTLGYSVKIRPNEFYLKFGTGRLELRPGMTATADVITGERRVISYFFAPIIDTLQGSLNER